LDVEVTQNDKWGAIFRKTAEEGIHLVEEVAKRTWWSVDHGNVELDRQGNRQQAWSSSADLVRCSRERTCYHHFGQMRSPVPPPSPVGCEVWEKE